MNCKFEMANLFLPDFIVLHYGYNSLYDCGFYAPNSLPLLCDDNRIFRFDINIY